MILSRRQPPPVTIILGFMVAGSLFVAAMLVRTWALEAKGLGGDPLVVALSGGSLALAAVAWLGMLIWFPRAVAGIGIEGLTAIGLVSGLRFVVAFGSQLLRPFLSAVMGPFANFFSEVVGEGIPALLIAALVVLYPKPGTLMLAYLTHFLLMVVFSGSFVLTGAVFMTVSISVSEVLLACLGVTSGTEFQTPRGRLTVGMVVRVALSIGVAKAISRASQWSLSQVMFRLQFPMWYIVADSLVVGLVYVSLGAAAGVVLGYSLRRTAR